MRGAIPPLPHMPSWRGAQLKHRDDFTFAFTCTLPIYDKVSIREGVSTKLSDIFISSLRAACRTSSCPLI
jgi:hypothetical protein